MNYIIQKLPLIQNVESINIFKHCINANKKLAELKGIANTIPNQDILINMLTLQEAKDSSEIENIVTTQDEIFKAELFETNISLDTKEVQNYIQALKVGFNNVTKHNILTTNHILDIQENLEKNRAGFRTSKGTVLKNNKNEIVYSPPQNYADILLLMNNLEQYINDDEICSLDPLIKMAIVHHQFESIHPFYDGNGRTGRIINILYLSLRYKF